MMLSTSWGYSPRQSESEADPVLAASVLLGQVEQDCPLEEKVLTPHSVQGASPVLDTNPGGQLTEGNKKHINILDKRLKSLDSSVHFIIYLSFIGNIGINFTVCKLP